MTTEKVTTSKEVDKVTRNLDDMKEAVFKIYRKCSDHFEGQSKGSTGWFNLDHEFLKRKLTTLESYFYKCFYEKDIEVEDMKPYKTFLVPFDSTKTNIFMSNSSLKNKEKT